MASKHCDFELCTNLFNDVKVDENFCPHSVQCIITHIVQYLITQMIQYLITLIIQYI